VRIFVTGATGFVGSAVVQELTSNGDKVLGLARSEESAEKLKALGIEFLLGDIEDLASLRRGAAVCAAVIHTASAFNQNDDAAKVWQKSENDLQAIEAMGKVLEGSERSFVITSGTALVMPGKLATETDRSIFTPENAGIAMGGTGEINCNPLRNAILQTLPSGESFYLWRSNCTSIGLQLFAPQSRFTLLDGSSFNAYNVANNFITPLLGNRTIISTRDTTNTFCGGQAATPVYMYRKVPPVK